MLRATVEPASAWPVKAAPCSLALTVSSPATVAIVGSEGAAWSSWKTTAVVWAPAFPARSTKRAVRLLMPSAPRSAALTVKSTYPVVMSPAVKVRTTGVAKVCPPRSSSTRSPGTRSVLPTGTVTRKVVLAASTAFSQASSSALPCGAIVGVPAGATRSSSKLTATLAVPRLPAASVITAVSPFSPSDPSSWPRTVKST